MSVRINHATHSDLPALAALELRSFPREALSERRLRYYTDRDTGLVLIASADGPEPVGYLVASLVRYGGIPTGWVITMAVSPKLRRRGIATRLLRRTISWARERGAVRVKLEVGQSNRAAGRLYDTLGFEPDRKLPDYFGPGLHAIRLVKTLSS